MSKPNKRNKKRAEKVCEHNKKVEVVNIDYTSITNAIIEANQKIKAIEGNKKEEQKEKDLEEWNQILHYKKCPNENSILIRIFFEIVNFITLTWSVLFFKKENAKKPVVTFNLLRMLLAAIFGICEYFLYFTMISVVYCLIINENGNG